MACLWSEDVDGAWLPMLLDARAHDLAPARIVRHAPPADDLWVLLGPPSVRVNGAPLDLGIRVLRDRDELRVGGERVFFSTETLAAIVPFPGSAQPTVCPRCKLDIVVGKAAVRCPGCRVWHHQCDAEPDALGCWLYAEICAAECGQPTALDAGFRWTPEGL